MILKYFMNIVMSNYCACLNTHDDNCPEKRTIHQNKAGGGNLYKAFKDKYLKPSDEIPL